MFKSTYRAEPLRDMWVVVDTDSNDVIASGLSEAHARLFAQAPALVQGCKQMLVICDSEASEPAFDWVREAVQETQWNGVRK